MATGLKAVEDVQIRRVLERWEQAMRDKDVAGIMGCYGPEIVAFDMIAPLRFVGKEAYRKNWEMGFEMCQDSGEFETRDLSISAGPETAFSHRLCRMSGTTKEGEPFDCWTRWTTCFRKINGQWLITHEHISVPFDMESGKALMDLKP